MSLSALAQLARSGKQEGPAEDATPLATAQESGAADDSVLEAAMDEFRGAADSKAALRSLRALIAHLK